MRTHIGLKSNGTLKVDSWLADKIKFSKGVRIQDSLLPRFKVFGCVLVICGGRDAAEVEAKAKRVKKFCRGLLLESKTLQKNT